LADGRRLSGRKKRQKINKEEAGHLETLHRIHILQEVYQKDYHSDMADRVLDKLIELERDKAQRELVEYENLLQSFEQRHRMLSEPFFERFQRGELGDNADFFEWSAVYDMYQSVQTRLSKLSSAALQ
jgi:hypothetical protein